ncbi:hypothetical protein AVDCRST_MAG82-1600 [uncultured Rubrobacteraceae bacterium]|uniref:Uncharacterized protein n=1 Tax=uncultured Rubrobacteraceae bacterium TaxID=349277 RepID=A0A6J4PVG4_9ACTN|nr:hypothetical protein AVDCRST_MAG82-1600 [uncultured Rubrobacteraceae bacterium]
MLGLTPSLVGTLRPYGLAFSSSGRRFSRVGPDPMADTPPGEARRRADKAAQPPC